MVSVGACFDFFALLCLFYYVVCLLWRGFSSCVFWVFLYFFLWMFVLICQFWFGFGICIEVFCFALGSLGLVLGVCICFVLGFLWCVLVCLFCLLVLIGSLLGFGSEWLWCCSVAGCLGWDYYSLDGVWWTGGLCRFFFFKVFGFFFFLVCFWLVCCCWILMICVGFLWVGFC